MQQNCTNKSHQMMRRAEGMNIICTHHTSNNLHTQHSKWQKKFNKNHPVTFLLSFFISLRENKIRNQESHSKANNTVGIYCQYYRLMRDTRKMNKTEQRNLKIQNMAKSLKQSMEEIELVRQESIKHNENEIKENQHILCKKT